jgi:transcriptional regulator with XRE-family HTH domain
MHEQMVWRSPMMRAAGLDESYARPEIRRALASGDWAKVLRAVLDTGMTQTEIANRAGISQAQVSRLARGQSRDPGMATLRALCDGLGIPRRLAGLAYDHHLEEPTDRRQLLAGALATAAAPVLPARVQVGDEELLRFTSLSYRRLEQHTPTRMLVGAVHAHLALAQQLAKACSDGQRVRLLGAISEIAGLAGWLHADLAEAAQARRFYRMSISAAGRAGHLLLPIYMQGSLGQYATSAGDPVEGLRLIREAAGRLPRSAPRLARAWLCALEGVALACAGERAGLALLDQADRHADAAQDDEPVWPWVFAFDARKIAAQRAVAAARLRLPAVALEAFTQAGESRSPKQAAVAAVDYARALADAGDVDEACRVAAAAYDTGRTYGSERACQSVRDFRGNLRAPARALRDLDDRIHTSYLEDW